MTEYSYERLCHADDAREQYLVWAREGKNVVGKYLVIGSEAYVQGEIVRMREAAKSAPINYRSNGVI